MTYSYKFNISERDKDEEFKFRRKALELGFIERRNSMIDCRFCGVWDYPRMSQHFKFRHPELFQMVVMFG